MKLHEKVRVRLEVAFQERALDEPTFTDIADHATELVVTRGRQTELDVMEPGTITATLKDHDREFDPFNPDSPYYPYVLPMRPARVIVELDDGTLGSDTPEYRLWTGFTDSWQRSWPEIVDSEVVVSGSDALKTLAREPLAENAWAMQMRALQPTAWYRFAEQEGATVALDSSGNGHDGEYENGPTRGLEGQMEEPGADRSFSCAHVSEQRMLVRDMSIMSQFPITFSFLVRIATVDEPGPNLVRAQQWDSFSGDFLAIGITPAGRFFVGLGNDGVTAVASAQTTQRVDNAVRHHLMAVVDSDENTTTITLYVDGVEDTQILSADPLRFPQFDYAIGFGNTPKIFDEHQPRSGFFGFFDDCAIWNGGALSETDAALLTRAMRGRYGDLPGDRINWILDCIGWPQNLRDIDEGASVLANAHLVDNALEYLRLVARTEGGILDVDPDGNIRFRSRRTILYDDASAQVQAEFRDEDDADIDYATLKIAPPDLHLRNVISVQRLFGLPQVESDQESIDAFWRQPYEESDLLAARDDEMRARAQWLLAHYKTPILRVDEVTVRPLLHMAEIPTICSLDLGHRVRIVRQPRRGDTPIGPPIEIECLIERIEHRFTVNDWTVTFTLSPAETQRYGRWSDGTTQWDDGSRWGY